MSGVVVLGRAGRSTRVLVNHLDRTVGIGRVVIEDPESRAVFLRRRTRRLGLVRVGGQVAFMSAIAPILQRRGEDRIAGILAAHGLDDSPLRSDRIERVRSVNDPETVELLQAIRPRVVVLSGTRIVAARVLEAVDGVVLNLHAGITPAYRGVHGGYWALADGRPDLCGATVHVVDAGVDTGSIVAQRRIHPGPGDSFATYPFLQLAAGLPALEDAVRAVVDDRRLPTVEGAGPSALRTHPTAWGYLLTGLRSGVW